MEGGGAERERRRGKRSEGREEGVGGQRNM